METRNYQSKIANNWQNINWKKAEADLANLQYEILKAHRKEDVKLISTAQDTLVRSFAARCIAVRKVTSNRGRKTPGIDGETYSKEKDKFLIVKAVKDLKNCKAEPVRRVYIPRPDGKEKIDITLFQIAYVEIKRHSLCSSINPYDPENYDYFRSRVGSKARHSILLGRVRSQLLKKQKGICPVCDTKLLGWEDMEVHHVTPRKQGGN